MPEGTTGSAWGQSMEITVHREAMRRFSELAEVVRRSLMPAPPPPPSRPLRGSLAHTPKKGEIKLGENSQPWFEFAADPDTGHYSALVIHSLHYHLAVSPEGIEALARLVSDVTRRAELRDLCSAEYVQSSIVNWLQAAQTAEARPWSDVLIEGLQRDVRTCRVLVPLQGIAIEEEFSVGAVRFGFFTREYFEPLCAGGTDEDAKIARRRFERYAGAVYACVECHAEPARARERTLEEVERVLGLLRFFDYAALDVSAPCGIGRMGAVNPRRECFFVERDGHLNAFSERAGRQDRPVNLSGPHLQRLMSSGLSRIDQLLRATDRTELQDAALNAMALFTAGLLSSNSAHRLMHALTAVESLLLKNYNEPIMASFVVRAAFVAGKTIEARRDIVSDLRRAYEVRSSFVHHGENPPADSVEVANKAVRHCWVVVLELLLEARWKTRADLLGALENRLLA
jgi:hypothetical protein